MTEKKNPDFAHERELWARGFNHVAGVDEVGRGPLAGPVCVAAVIFAPEAKVPAGVHDSKKLDRARRAALAPLILETAAAAALVFVPAADIDRLNIRAATLEAMSRALRALALRPDFALIDGRDAPLAPCPTRPLVAGDARSLSIAAASILAKVARDRLMDRADVDFPGYDFAAHAGYGTLVHRKALTRLGPCPLHRLSFKSRAVTGC